MITRARAAGVEGEETVVHLFAGSGGCTLGTKRAGLRSLGSFDFDAKACRDLVRLTGGPAFAVDLATVTKQDMLDRVPESPDSIFMSPPCKAFSSCLPAEQAAAEEYVAMAQLALAGVVIACTTWKKLPAIIVIENVPRITTSGSEVLEQMVKLLHRYGYSIDQSAHDCGEIGGLAQHRDRFLLVARQPEVAQDWLRRPPKQRVRAVGEVLGQLPSPVSAHGDEMHRQPRASAMTWARLAFADPKKIRGPQSKGDWRDIPERFRCVWGEVPEGVRVGGQEKDRHAGKVGVEAWDEPAHTVIGAGARPPSSRCSTQDPRLGRMAKPARPGSRKAKGAPDDFGVGLWGAPHTTVRGRMEPQTSRSSVSDLRVGAEPPRSDLDDQHTAAGDVSPGLKPRASRKNGGSGVSAWTEPAHAVLAEGSVQNCNVSVAEPRLGCRPRAGAMGVQPGDEPATAIVGHHSHDNSVGSYADPKLSYRNADRIARADRQEPGRGYSGRGDFGVLNPAKPSPTVRGRMDVRQATAAILDDRGWPVPTHYMVYEDGEHVLYGPYVDFASKKPCLLVIAVQDGEVDPVTGRRGWTWHRPMTDRELACLQGFPIDCYLEGPSSTTPARKATATKPARAAIPGRREHIGNAIPPPTAEAIGRMIVECLRSSRKASFLRPGDVWVERAISNRPRTRARSELRA